MTAVSLSILLFFPGHQLQTNAQTCSGPSSVVNHKHSYSCGGHDYNLGYKIQGHTYWMLYYYLISGVCNGSYTGCACDYVPPNVVPGSYLFQSAGNPIDGWDIWYTITEPNWPTYTVCTTGECAGAGLKESVTTYETDWVGYSSVCCVY
jgi:hypothetical protein